MAELKLKLPSSNTLLKWIAVLYLPTAAFYAWFLYLDAVTNRINYCVKNVGLGSATLFLTQEGMKEFRAIDMRSGETYCYDTNQDFGIVVSPRNHLKVPEQKKETEKMRKNVGTKK